MKALLLICAFLFLSHADHVVFIHNVGTKSHLILMKPLMEELLNRKHKVTSIIYGSVTLTHENYTEIVISSDMDKFYSDLSKQVMQKGGGNALNPSMWLWAYNMYSERMKDMASEQFKSDKVKDMIKLKQKVDAVVIVFPWNAVFAELFNCPIIAFSPNVPLTVFMKGSTQRDNPSIKPFPAVPFIEPMNFRNRLLNHFMIQIATAFIEWQTNGIFGYQQEYLRKELGLTVSHPDVILRERSSITIACSHPLTQGAWQNLPNVIEVRRRNPQLDAVIEISEFPNPSYTLHRLEGST